MPSCAIACCNNSDKNCKNTTISFHRFPTDEATKKIWLNACKRADDFPLANSRVCSEHFHDSDFERDLKAELLNLKPKKVLKPSAFPRLKIPTKTGTGNNEERSARIKKRENKKVVGKLLSASQTNETNRQSDVREITENLNESNDREKTCTLRSLQNEIFNLKHENSRLLNKCKCLSNENTVLKCDLSKYKQIFSPCQMKRIEKGVCSSWSSDDISKAVTLRSISAKAFKFIRQTLKYPLPSGTTIKRRLSQIEVSPGFVEISFNLLKSHTIIFTDFEKDVILSYDEMTVKSDICYDVKQDVMRGPHKNVQVVVVRSLVGKWKQPVFYNFDCSMTKELFYEIVQKVESTGFKVRGFVGDMGGSNQKLLSELGISANNSNVKSPVDENRRIWAFCDVPHMLKLLRNHLIDEGFQLCDGKTVKTDVFEKIISSQSNDLKYAHKVTPNHLLVKGPERQNVRMAAELLSGTMASAIGYLLENQEHAQHFVQTINDGFDVLNSRCPNDVNPIKCAYGINFEEQEAALEKLQNLCSSMRAIGKKGLLPFQKGFLISIQSARGLFQDLKTEGYTYLMTSRCNQDVIESYFSQIRGLGRFYDHPLPTSVSQRIKSLLLSRNASSIIKPTNCSDDDSVTLSVDVFNTNNEGEENDLNETETVTEPYLETEEELRAVCDDEQDVSEQLTKEDTDLIKMLAGYVSYRVSRQNIVSTFVYGHPTKECTKQKDWLSTLSRGYLMNPTEEWLNMVLKMEKDFEEYHGKNGLSNREKVMKTLIDKLKVKYPVDEFAITCYVRTRTFIRMKSLNKARANKRSYGDKQTDAGRKKNKKLNKLQ